ncbi:Cytochrome c-551 [Paraburkholderia nemoris]|uniref:c-type cytochrome n=1 Tax=Paraburkholderia nemoris TaxID=2793076 RepID=UPI001909E771|nr:MULTISPECIES: c-type cytochrome [Paraburkholderia]MBK3780901.1 c-type cytochrome [Paraburkholderia aspalathi]CAE6814576.1 Cytochrome c-551 [Paraburkholderia nemoris]CAE6828872.1 Cytochrome c-551 [Paraburkholderia nemoris]
MTRGVAFVVAMLTAGAFTSSARAADAPRGQIVATSNACMGCHAVDRKLVGPSFQQIATKYKGDAQAPAKLSRKVKDGGSGVWGMIPMPAHQSMSDADIRTVVDWVLAGAPSK